MHQNKINDIEQRIREFNVEIQKKYAIAFACVVFVILGVPIGMMIKTSGVGVAFTVSTIIFIVYYICLVTGESWGDKGLISPIIAMWSANVIFGVFGVYLIILSTKDTKTMNIDKWKEMVKKIFDKIMARKPEIPQK